MPNLPPKPTSANASIAAKLAWMVAMLLSGVMHQDLATAQVAGPSTDPLPATDPFLKPLPEISDSGPAKPSLTVPVSAAPLSDRDVAGDADGPGNGMIRQSIEQLSRLRSIEAHINQQVNMFGRSVLGVGEYRQINVGQDSLIRLDLKLQLDEQVASLQQIVDGKFIWTYEERPLAVPSAKDALADQSLGSEGTGVSRHLSRVNLDLVKEAYAAENIDGSSRFQASMPSLGQGGLSGMLSELGDLFSFTEPKAGKLHSTDVWLLFGTWKPSVAEELFRDEKKKQGAPGNFELPGHIPHQVIIALGRSDLFPFRFEYRRRVADQPLNGIVVKTNMREIASIELSRVAANVDIDQRQFARQNHDLPVIDRTAEFLLHRRMR